MYYTNMRRVLILLFLLLLPEVSFSQPSILFDREVYDFDTVDQGSILEHVFIFRNTGDEELFIERLVPS